MYYIAEFGATMKNIQNERKRVENNWDEMLLSSIQYLMS